jgi:hypothetical protein
LIAAGKTDLPAKAAPIAAEAIDSGVAKLVLERLVEHSRAKAGG